MKLENIKKIFHTSEPNLETFQPYDEKYKAPDGRFYRIEVIVDPISFEESRTFYGDKDLYEIHQAGKGKKIDQQAA